MIPSTLLPLEHLLSSGGDTRLDVDAATGRNRYGCSPRPSDVVPFGSCTSSSITPRGYAAAQETQRIICAAPDSTIAADHCARRIRGRLHELLTLPAGVEVALAPSGTDVELLALALAAGNSNRPLMNIVVGPSEVGSGTPQAAACLHYDEVTPSSARVAPGEPVDPRLASQIILRTVDLRTASGSMRFESDIDAAVLELVLEAVDLDAIVLVHIVAHSKTGVHAPSLACVERLRQLDDGVVVVVDAAQGRFSRRGLRDVLQKDYLVMFTGSKFYGGPPFSGALLVPSKFHPRARGLSKLPSGFRDYFSAAEMPESWSDLVRSLNGEPNLGALLRWSAALAEMDAYYAAPSGARLRVLRFFETEVPRILGNSKSIRMLPVFPPVYEDTAERLLESKTTVFGFWVTPPHQNVPLGKVELKQMHFDLATDLAGNDNFADGEILARKYHLGQPVELGPAGCVLRVALGGELITRVATDRQLGARLDDRLEWLRDQIYGLRQKIEYLAAFRGAGQVARDSTFDAARSTVATT